MKRSAPKKAGAVESASAFIDEKIEELGDWRGKMLAKVREIIHEADPEIVEERKWVRASSPGTPVFSHGGIVCTGETYKSVVKITFAKGASLKDPSGLFNSSLEGNVRRAIDIHEGDKIDKAALKDLIRAAVALNVKGKQKPPECGTHIRIIHQTGDNYGKRHHSNTERAVSAASIQPSGSGSRSGVRLRHGTA
jgi:hypothetical protein